MEDIKEDPPKLGKINKNKIIVPNLLKKVSTSYAYFLGNIPTKIFPPSKGWIGIRLKIANETLSITNGTATIVKAGKTLAMIDTINAIIKFDAGPAREIIAESFLGFFRL